MRAFRPEFVRALEALHDGDTLVITTLDRLGRSTQNMLAFADELRTRDAGLRVLNLGGGRRRHLDPHGVDALHDHGRARSDGVRDQTGTGHRLGQQRREAGKDLGGRPQRITDSHIRSAIRLVESGEPAAQVARDLGMSRASFNRRSRELAGSTAGSDRAP
ncbi:hypothetical protein L3i23_04400 [Herbiconiux sp. L3-i23]|nr:hypothetical protein L3i23_04400 [Herbiconiux sp. L3-i23]